MKIYIIPTFIILLLNLNIVNANDCNHTQNSFKCVEYIRNYDGDTITFNIPNIHPLLGKKISIRVNGIDTPEIRTKNECEKIKAIKAKKFVKSLLVQAKNINLINIKRGKYFRIVADVIIDGHNLTDILIKKKFGYTYKGKTKKKINWCEKL